MTNFLKNDFLLHNSVAKWLYFSVAKDLPIIDYHCHLPSDQIAKDYKFKNLTDIWLKGDHYKWRAMRTNGVAEAYCTGDASDRQKFNAFAQTVPYTIGNPLYHWTHLELRRPFGLTDVELNPNTADRVWDYCNEMLSDDGFSARSILKKMNVQMVGTTDDPIDDLSAHNTIAMDKDFSIKVLPTWRPDKSLNIKNKGFLSYMAQLSIASGVKITDFKTLCQSLTIRLDHFEEHGCTIADHALDVVDYCAASTDEVTDILNLALADQAVSAEQAAKFKTAILIFLGEEYCKRGWVQQYHIGALRNNNTLMLDRLGPDTGFDSINDRPIAVELSALLDAQAKKDMLPKTILYCLNPRDNEVIATMCGNFQGSGIVGKVQFGSGWWFNDQKDGMQRQMQQLAQLGLLSRFIGMLTDSRSFLSYTRHEYFRRILCNMIGQWVEAGEAPNNEELLATLVRDICFQNANKYFEFNIEGRVL